MKGRPKRLSVADQIRKGLEESIRHAEGKITLKTTVLDLPDRALKISGLAPRESSTGVVRGGLTPTPVEGSRSTTPHLTTDLEKETDPRDAV